MNWESKGESFKATLNQFGINISNLKYLIKLIDRYGIEIAKKGKNCYYSPELKQKMRILKNESTPIEGRKTEIVRGW